MKLNNAKAYLVFLLLLSTLFSCLVISYARLKTFKRDNIVPEAQKIDKELLKSKSTFKLFQALRFTAIGSGVFKPLEFVFNRMSRKLDLQDKDKSNAKCGRKAIKQNYENIIKESVVKIQDEKLATVFEERLRNLITRCNKFVEHALMLKDLTDLAKKEKPSKIEVKESMLKNINDAKDCLADFKKVLFAKKADLSLIKPPCQLILGNLGCNTKDLANIKDCLQGKKDKNGKALVDSPIDITEKLASIQINTTKEHPHPLISDLEKTTPENCNFIKGIDVATKGKKVSPLKKFVIRVKALLVTFNDILKCKGVYKPYMEVFNTIDLGSFMQMIINMLTLDNLPKTNKRLLSYVSDFVFQTLHYFDKKKKVARTEKPQNKLKLYILMSRHFGAAIGRLLRIFFHLFKTNWISVFRSTTPGEIVKVTDTVVDGVKIFDDFNLHTNKDDKKSKPKFK
jgi:hypothetical protein